MNKIKFTFFTFIFLCCSVLSQTELSADKIFDLVDNSVVVVLAYDSQGNIFQGSGVVVSGDGLIATNYHVINGANRIEIRHYSRIYNISETVYTDPQKDILIVRADDMVLKPLAITTVNNLKAGQRVYAIGSPEGYENSISEGIISGFRFDENNVRLIQMTSPITEGSSGGAVVNSKGELIGLSMSGQHEGNLYFALPVSEITAFIGPGINYTETEINYFTSGTLAAENQNFEDAEFYFSKYLDKFSNDIVAYYSRGYARFKLKEYNNAISDFNRVIDQDKFDGKTYFYRGNCYFYSKNYKNAYEDYSHAIMLETSDADIFYNRGFASFKLNDFEGAINDWEKAIALNPGLESELTVKIQSAKNKMENR